MSFALQKTILKKSKIGLSTRRKERRSNSSGNRNNNNNRGRSSRQREMKPDGTAQITTRCRQMKEAKILEANAPQKTRSSCGN